MSGQRVRVLVTGASGYLGQHLIYALAQHEKLDLTMTCGVGNEHFQQDFVWCGTILPCDFKDEKHLANLVSNARPDLVVHLAAMSSPAACQRDAEAARKINCPRALIDALPAHSRIIFLSTDQVFDGLQKHRRYSESDVVKPVNTYGRTKLQFEEALLQLMPGRSVILRSSLILGPPTLKRCKKQSFLQFCTSQFAKGEVTDFFSDEVRSVVYVCDIVKVIEWFILEPASSWCAGVFHMGGPTDVTRVDVARAVAAAGGFDCSSLIRSVERASLAPSEVASPPDLSMDSSKLVELTGFPRTTLLDMVMPRSKD